ncbi:MAG: hypothetical protein RIS47_830 [Bacteroidota bacterium]|jgi:hypothetical protein
MKINWGWGIAIFLIIFMISMLGFVYFSFQQPVNLVEKDYYPKGLDYDQEIQKKKDSRAFESRVKIAYESGVLQIQLPDTLLSDSLTGKVLLYKPEDSHLDKEFELKPDSLGNQQIKLSSEMKGRYTVKLDFQSSKLTYYFENNILIQ